MRGGQEGIGAGGGDDRNACRRRFHAAGFFADVLATALGRAPPRVAAGFGDHVAYGGRYVGDVLPCGTFVGAMVDPLTGYGFEAPLRETHTLHVVEAR